MRGPYARSTHVLHTRLQAKQGGVDSCRRHRCNGKHRLWCVLSSASGRVPDQAGFGRVVNCVVVVVFSFLLLVVLGGQGRDNVHVAEDRGAELCDLDFVLLRPALDVRFLDEPPAGVGLEFFVNAGNDVVGDGVVQHCGDVVECSEADQGCGLAGGGNTQLVVCFVAGHATVIGIFTIVNLQFVQLYMCKYAIGYNANCKLSGCHIEKLHAVGAFVHSLLLDHDDSAPGDVDSPVLLLVSLSSSDLQFLVTDNCLHHMLQIVNLSCNDFICDLVVRLEEEAVLVGQGNFCVASAVDPRAVDVAMVPEVVSVSWWQGDCCVLCGSGKTHAKCLFRVIWLSAGAHCPPSGLSLFLRGLPRVGPHVLVCMATPLNTGCTQMSDVPLTWFTRSTPWF